MDTDLLTKVAEWLEDGGTHVGDDKLYFDMRCFIDSEDEFFIEYEDQPAGGRTAETGCGTVSCIAGAAMQFGGYVKPGTIRPTLKWEERNRTSGTWLPTATAPGWALAMGITVQQARELCMAGEEIAGLPKFVDISPAWAARTIRHLIATGHVDWRATQFTGA